VFLPKSVSDQLMDAFLAVASPAKGESSGLSGVVSGASSSGEGYGQVGSATVGSAQKPGSSVPSELESVAAAALGPIPALINAFAGLFEGAPSAAPLFPKFELPGSINFQAEDNGQGGGLQASDYNQMGQPRAVSSSPGSSGDSSGSAVAAPAAASSPSVPTAAANPSLPASGGHTFNNSFTIQAMDAQSVMDRSDDIASAVQAALLNSHPLSDTIGNI
jgi:hypothetical protein